MDNNYKNDDERGPSFDQSLPKSVNMSKEELLEAYRRMVRIRRCEMKIRDIVSSEPGVLHQWVHSSEGEEACCVGVAMAMRQGDIYSGDILEGTHRSHGFPIAMGVDLGALMAELFGKATGTNKGRGGTMHIADINIGMIGSNSIVGTGGKAVGAAMAFRVRGTDQVGISVVGDGGVNKSAFLESLNLAAIQDLPVIFVVVNNQYEVARSVDQDNANVRAGGQLSDRAAGFAIPGLTVDGNDFFAVYKAAKYCISRARAGKGPSLLELLTYRHRSHCFTEMPHEVDWLLGRPDELSYWLRRDPITQFELNVVQGELITQDELDDINKAIEAEIEEAVEHARESPYPDPDEVYRDIYA
ncbi:MAG: thiamine pyrophosphate-dependent dehydrogenase E1 component subunit alpha [Dehalococcoidia bacterium]|nr:MAG: thiamine pyrophosphate-dependent dehydrogenase E1 component subunit alpha [Dehalococcoidia bacterium]